MNVAIYTRVSTRDQEHLNQLAQLRRFAVTQGWTIAAEYQDTESGGKKDRPALLSMMEAASRHEFDVVLFWSLDRFSREGVIETLTRLNQLTSYGVNYRSFTQQYFDSCGMFRDVVISIFATMAKQERLINSDRTKAGLQRARSQGKRLGRPSIDVNLAAFTLAAREGRPLSELAGMFRLSKTTAARLRDRVKAGSTAAAPPPNHRPKARQ